MKVLLFSHELTPEGGGAGVVALEYCKELISLGYKVTLLTKHKAKYPAIKGLDVIGVVYFPKFYLIPYYFKLKKINKEEYSHIILNDMVSVYVAGFCFSEMEFIKSTSIIHGSEPEIVYSSPDFFQKLMGLNYFYNKAISRVKRIVAVSFFMKNKFITQTTFKEAKKIEVHYSKLGTDFYPMQKNYSKPRIPGSNDVILTVARLEKKKGFLEMYRIFKVLVNRRKSFKWIIVGDGGFKDEFEALVNNELMGGYIDFVGKVPRQSLRSYYNSANVFWLLSEYKESFGLVYLEAQACFCPAIGFNRDGVKESINHKKTGFLVDSPDECIDIFLDRSYEAFKPNDFYNFLDAIYKRQALVL